VDEEGLQDHSANHLMLLHGQKLPIPVKSATHSSRSRPGIPVEVGHLFR